MISFEPLEKKIGYSFKNKEYLQIALTHSSFANEKHNTVPSNERLEFFGDSILSFVTAEYLFKTYPDLTEGELSKMRSSLVCEWSLADFSRELGVGKYLFLGKGELHSGGRERESILENTFESLVAAIYLDGGIEEAKKFILRFISRPVSKEIINHKDCKTVLQEIIQQNPDQSVTYVVVDESGPDHNKSFTVEVHLNSNPIGRGTGRSKKQAEQAAAKEALSLMGL